MTDERRFSRHEAALVLRRATDGEHTSAPASGPGSGLSLDELVAAAREAGIDPAAVRLAAAVAPARPDPVARLLVGAPVNPEVRGRFPGRLAPGHAGAVRSGVEHALDRTGELEEAGSQLIWREEHGFGRSEVSAGPENDAVEVVAVAERGGHLLALVMSVAMVVGLALLPLGGFAGLTALGGPLLAVLGPLAAIVGGTRLLWPALQRSTLRRLESAVFAVGALVENAPPPASPER
jgi:hypothetical protein